MKQPVNFRLNQRSMAVLESLVQSRGISKTQVVEEALDHYVPTLPLLWLKALSIRIFRKRSST